jgi:hypothetical protein
LAESGRKIWIVAFVIVAILLVGIGYYVAVYINQPDETLGLWNGTIKYGAYYYESTFNFSSNGTCDVALHPKPQMTFNVTQPVLPPVITMSVNWAKNNSTIDLFYPDGKVKLFYPDIPHTLRFSEDKMDGFVNPYIGYISKNYRNLEDFNYN